MGPAQISAHIVPLLRSAQAALRTGALDALRLSFNTMPGLLPGLLQDPDADVRLLSCELARSLPSAEATRRLCVLLADEQNVNVCAAALEVVSEVGDPPARSVLRRSGSASRKHPFLPFAVRWPRIASPGNPHAILTERPCGYGGRLSSTLRLFLSPHGHHVHAGISAILSTDASSSGWSKPLPVVGTYFAHLRADLDEVSSSSTR